MPTSDSDSPGDSLRKGIEEIALGMGAASFGVADLDRLKARQPGLLDLVPGDYSRAVVIGVRLQRAVLEGIVDRPTPLYFHHYRQVNYQLDRIALAVAGKIQGAGFRSLAIPASQIIARDPMRGHVSHRMLGEAAGIGFIGRSTLLVHPKYGAQVRYVSVLTDMPLVPCDPLEGNCGSCTACVEVCPAKAIGERKEDYDLDACYAKLDEFVRMPFIGQHICGVCVKTCDGGGEM